MNYDDAQKRGGGVRVYQENLVAELSKIPGMIIYTLSSGVRYDLFGRRVYIAKRRGTSAVHSYEVVNSPIVAPAHAAFDSLYTYLYDKTLQPVIKDFLNAHGPFDVFQFDNLEGLTAGILALKDQFPKTCFIYYLHNYNLVCPQVNLWFSESETCDNYNEGKRCSVCIPQPIAMREVRLAHSIASFLQSIRITPHSFAFRMVYRQLAFSRRVTQKLRSFSIKVRRNIQIVRSSAIDPNNSKKPKNLIYSSELSGSIYKQYREQNVSILNGKFDHVLAVSNRVRELAIQFGITEQKISVAYIGSAFATQAIPIRVRKSDHLTIAYLGYEKRDKGFYHFVDALEAIPRLTAKNISVLIAAKLQSPEILNRLTRLAVEFRNFEIVDGYDHHGLGQMLAGVDLGIVPVLWEDALPQVAIEFVAHGVPVLSSDLGGTKELCGSNSRFFYRHGNVDELITKIEYFLHNRSSLYSFNDNGTVLIDMERHVRFMLEHFYTLRSHRTTIVDNSGSYATTSHSEAANEK